MSIRLRHPVPGAPRGNRYGPRAPIYIDGKWTPGFHNGQDFPAPAGTPILAAADGTVGYAGWVTTGGGNWTRIDHAGNWKTHYGHQSRITVRPGQRVKAGQVIGYVGTTGMSTGNHLHFELSLGTVRRDPWPYISATPAPNPTPAKGKPKMFMIHTDAYMKDKLRPGYRWAIVGPGFWHEIFNKQEAHSVRKALGTPSAAYVDGPQYRAMRAAAMRGVAR